VYLLLTDRLTCPRCGPGFGLILLADALEDRVVLQGSLGCHNCRDAFPIAHGFGDLRAPPRGALGDGLVGSPGPAADPTEGRLEAERQVALLGIVGGPGTLALVGGPARWASEVSSALPEVHVVAIDADLRLWPEAPGVSRLVCAPGLPFADASLRGVVVDGRLGGGWLREAARAVVPRGRVVVEGATAGAGATLEQVGLRVVAQEGETVVAARS
jgi:hypothetical protein